MYFSNTKLTQQLVQNREWFEKNLKQLIKELSQELNGDPNSHESFGPFWMPLKNILKIYSPSKKAWFQGGGKRLVSQNSKELHKELSAEMTESEALETIQKAMLYRDLILDALENQSLLLKKQFICAANEEIRLENCSDPDAQGQLDLFFEIEFQNRNHEQFLNNPQYYTPRYWEERAKRFMDENKNHQAALCFMKAIETTEGLNKRQDFWFFAGEAYFDIREIDKALFCFSQAYELKKDAWIIEKIAECHYELGQYELALGYYEQALSAMPGNPEIQYHIARLEKKFSDHSKKHELAQDFDVQQPESFDRNELSFFGSANKR